MYGFGYVLLFSAILLAFANAQELYSDKYDYIDPEEILGNDRLRNQYYNCFMDTAPCVTDDAVFFKGHLPEAIVTKCSKCTEKQKSSFARIVEWYADNAPEEWNALVAKTIQDARNLGLMPS